MKINNHKCIHHNINSNSHSNHNLNIVKINYAIAFRIGNIIYLNKNLDKYPELKKAIIKHELEHTKGFGLRDIITDLKGKHLNKVKKEYYKFLFTEKKAWYQFIPILKVKGKWSLDLITLMLWILFLITFGVVYRIITW